MESKNGMMAKIGLLYSFLFTSFLVCGLPIFVMQAVSVYHASHGAAGALESYQNLPMVIVSFIVFSYIMRIGYRKTLILVSVVMAVVCFIMPFLNHFWAVKMFLILAGAAFVCMKITIYSAIALVTADKKGHASFMSILEGVFMFGMMLGMWVYSEFIQGNWMHAFWVFSVISISNAVYWSFVKLNENEVEKAKEQSVKESFKGMKKLLGKKAVLFYTVLLIVYALIEQGTFSWLPNYNSEILHLPKEISVRVGSFMIGFIAVGRIVGGFILKYVKWEKVFAVYFLLGLALMLFTSYSLRHGFVSAADENSTLLSLPWEAYSLPLLGFLIGPVIPVINSAALTCLPKYMHAEMITLMVIISAVASSIASRLMGGMFTWVGGQSAFEMITIIPLVILLLCIIPYSMVLNKTERELKLQTEEKQ